MRAGTGTITIAADQPGVKVSPVFQGLMTEEINYSYDGGLYAELVQNRIFKDNATDPVHWSLVNEGGKGTLALDPSQPLNKDLDVSLKLEIQNPGKRVGVANDGYWGIPVKPHTDYTASFYAKASDGFSGNLTVSIESIDGKTTYASAPVTGIGTNWSRHTVKLVTGDVPASSANRLVLFTSSPGTVWLDLVSLMPPTFKNRPNGLRPDLMEKMGRMKPAFLRFPGGNYLEGQTLAERFEWKKTIGPLENRPGHKGPWGYRSSDGLGLMEFLLWCEDLGMEPLLAVHAGYALNGDHVTPGPDLDPYVQDALVEIEFLTGDVSTKWGAERARNGHPAPFALRYVEIGNEDWFDKSGSYDGRYAQIHDAIRAKYPDLKLIATAPVKSRRPDVVDDHFYETSPKMMRDSTHYDRADRNGPKVFVGEWASQDIEAPWAAPGEKGPTPSMKSALGDAAWLMGLERNSDHVIMHCYAPLLVNVNPGGRQWAVNLIGYDALTSFGSPSFHVQQMFAENQGANVLPVTVQLPSRGAAEPGGGIGIGTWATQAEFKDIRVTKGSKELFRSDFSKGIGGWKLHGGKWKASEGVLRQSGESTNVTATTGDATWTNYTLDLKARKTGGQEGFLISFLVNDDGEKSWWNIGGFGNRTHSIESVGIPPDPKPGSIETGKWYDIRIEVTPDRVRCYLDGKLVHDVPVTRTPRFQATAVKAANGEIILRAVNAEETPQEMSIDVTGANPLSPTASETLLTSEKLSDLNTIDHPDRIVPTNRVISGVKNPFLHSFPPRSFSIIRFKEGK
jgi:alpha-L-arabinofuranosidase